MFYREGEPGTEFEIWPAEGPYPRVVERIMPGAFDKALAEDDVRATVNHDASLLLGRSGAGTLRLSVDEKGLRYEIDPPDTTVGRDTVASIKRGDVTGSSFMFAPRKTVTRDLADEKTGSKTVIVERTDVRLLDVGPVTYPAYKATEASMRSMPDEVRAIRSEIDQDKALADLAEGHLLPKILFYYPLFTLISPN